MNSYGKGTLTGESLSGLECNAPWTLDIEPENGFFKGGKATAEVHVFGCNGGCFSVNVTAIVHLHPDNE